MIGLPSTDWVSKDIGEEIHKNIMMSSFLKNFQILCPLM
jgi:hypothetical protein